MPSLEELKQKVDKEVVLWIVAFVGVCVLVGMGKLAPQTIEMFLFAILGRASTRKNEST